MQNNNNSNKKSNERFGTDGDQVKQIIKHADAEKRQASGSNSNVEFGNETDINEIKQKVQQAEAKKQQASILKNNGFKNE